LRVCVAGIRSDPKPWLWCGRRQLYDSRDCGLRCDCGSFVPAALSWNAVVLSVPCVNSVSGWRILLTYYCHTLIGIVASYIGLGIHRYSVLISLSSQVVRLWFDLKDFACLS
jgi:hypothetical protein